MTRGTYFPRSWINGANRSRWSPLIWVSPASWTRQLGLNNELKEGDRWVEFLGIWGGHYATRDGGFYGDSLVQEAEGSSQGWLDTHCCGLIVGFWSLVVGGRVKDESHDVKLPFKVKAKVVVIRIMTLQADLAFYSVDVTVFSWWPASFLGLFFIFFDLSELPSRTIYIYSCQPRCLSQWLLSYLANRTGHSSLKGNATRAAFLWLKLEVETLRPHVAHMPLFAVYLCIARS